MASARIHSLRFRQVFVNHVKLKAVIRVFLLQNAKSAMNISSSMKIPNASYVVMYLGMVVWNARKRKINVWLAILDSI